MEKHPTMLDKLHGKHTLMQVHAIQGRILSVNSSYHEVVWNHQVKQSCNHPLMLDQATLEGYDFSIKGYLRVLLS